jgi:hypothetical protein
VVKKLLVVALALLVSACGVKPTPVIQAGPAPTLRNAPNSGQGADIILYFVIDGRMTPVTRPASRSVGVDTALSLLLAGPTYAEAAAGYTTMLPRDSGSVGLAADSPRTIKVPFPVAPLNVLAVNQLVCTAFAAIAAENSMPVDNVIALAGTDTKLPPQTCQAF